MSEKTSDLLSSVLIDGPDDAAQTFLFAHGAGGPMDSPFMTRVATGMAAQGIRVVRFEFPYMAARRVGEKRPPDRQPELLDAWRRVVAEIGNVSALAKPVMPKRLMDSVHKCLAARRQNPPDAGLTLH